MNDLNVSVLDNGLRVITLNIPGWGSTALNIGVGVGSKNEHDPRLMGMSHFMEHMRFKDTTNRSTQEIAESFDRIGGHFNAFTSRENTVFYSKTIAQHFDQNFDILSDMMVNSIFDSGEIEREQGVILQELARYVDDPESYLGDEHIDAAFKGQPIGQRIIGTTESIKALRRDDFLRFHAEYYTGANMICVVVGNVEHKKAVDLAAGTLGKLPRGQQTQYSFATARPSKYVGGEFIGVRQDLEQVHLCIGFQGASYMDADYWASQVFAVVAGGGMSSRLFQEVREKLGLAYGIAASLESYGECGILDVASSTTMDKVEKLVEVTMQQLRDLAHNVTDAEIERAKAQLVSTLVFGEESVITRARAITNSFFRFGRYIDAAEKCARINSVTAHDVMRVAQKLLADKNPTFSAIGAEKCPVSRARIVQLMSA